MASYAVILAPSGIDLRSTISKLKHHLGKNITPADIEDTLCDDVPDTRKALKPIALRNPPKISMYDVTWHLPRSKVAELWQKAVEQCLNKFKSPSNSSVKILSGHLTYYGGQRDEFYSVFNAGALLSDPDLKPSHVVLLIDDVYDMYLRLTKKGDLYDHKTRMPDYFSQIKDEEKVEIQGIDKEDIASLCIEWEVGVLTHLFTWRYLEIILAENLAAQLKSNFLVMGVKQLTKAVAYWIKEQEPKSVYLSHPIAEPRRERRKKGKWPPFVTQVNKMQEALLNKGIVCVMPTAIDEYRFASRKTGSRSLHKHTGFLEKRWPLLGDLTELLYSQPDGARDVNHDRLLLPKYWNFSEEKLVKYNEKPRSLEFRIDTYFRSFTRQIQFQIASRDHLLVTHTNGLLVLRPFYGGRPEFSGGVMKEVAHWETLVRSGQEKRAAFVHFNKDIKDMLEARRKDPDFPLYDEFEGEMTRIAKKEHGINERDFLELIKGKKKKDTLGESSILPPIRTMIKNELPNIRKKAKINLLRKYLTAMVEVRDEVPDKDKKDKSVYVGVWILDDSNQLTKSCSRISQFLKTGSPPDNNWQMRIEEIFPDKLLSRRKKRP